MVHYLRGRSDLSWSAGLDMGIAPFLGFRRCLVIADRERGLEALVSLGTYLKSGNLNSRELITLIKKVIPIWVHTISDVGSLPLPDRMSPAIGEIQKPKLHKILRVRVKFLGLPWKQRSAVNHETMSSKVPTLRTKSKSSFLHSSPWNR